MPNVTKIIGAGAKAVRTVVGSNKDIKTNKKINKTLEKTLGTKTISQGKQKAINKANYKIDGTRRTEGVGAVKVTKSGKLKEYMSDAPVKGTTRKVRDNAQRAELEAKGYPKRVSVLKYPSNKLFKSYEKQTNPKPKVPVKKKAK